ncbi:hypothetical protein GCM10010172_23250 [Paractinoplanes ferrugineus]|uniref:Uncharacterized protein n=1 Tax=Paractinoplanes ferrugineus TaxID=113564 RepID=A0A919MBT7_9ACTN|nr:hypothetical protein Afe05nite_06040 [Actinoplanes ferrugineus]
MGAGGWWLVGVWGRGTGGWLVRVWVFVLVAGGDRVGRRVGGGLVWREGGFWCGGWAGGGDRENVQFLGTGGLSFLGGWDVGKVPWERAGAAWFVGWRNASAMCASKGCNTVCLTVNCGMGNLGR